LIPVLFLPLFIRRETTDKSEKKKKIGSNETDAQKYFKYAQIETTELLLHHA